MREQERDRADDRPPQPDYRDQLDRAINQDRTNIFDENWRERREGRVLH